MILSFARSPRITTGVGQSANIAVFGFLPGAAAPTPPAETQILGRRTPRGEYGEAEPGKQHLQVLRERLAALRELEVRQEGISLAEYQRAQAERLAAMRELARLIEEETMLILMAMV
jgi:hypothetical protein